MIRTELEIAFRVVWDPAKPLAPGERSLLLKGVGIAKELQILRGKATTELESIEAKMHEIPELTRSEAMAAKADTTLPAYLAQERRLMEEALRRTGGNITHAAAAVGMLRRTFYNKCRRYGIELDDRARPAPAMA